MKKRTILGVTAMVVVAALCVALGTWNDKPKGGTAIYTPGTYEASAWGFQSDVKVTVTVDADHVTAVTVDSSGETAALGGAAGETLAANALAADGGEFDGVAGATMTSDAVKAAVADCLSQAKAGGAAGGVYTPGTYTSQQQGYLSVVTINVTVDESKITAVDIDASGETPTLGGAAAETMAQAALEANSAEVDGVTGSTFTSNAVKAGLADCLAQARGEKAPEGGDTAAVADGTYTGKAPSFGVMKEMELSVTFKDGKITAIDTLCAGSATQADEDEYSPIYATVADYLYPRIIERQSLAVDSIAGATVSSGTAKSIIAAIIDANGGNSADWYTPVEKSTKTVELKDYDVIVVGLGSSGVASYLSAAQNGATVFGIETAAKLGGNGTNTAGPLGVNPAKQVAANGGEPFVNPDELLTAWMEYTENDAKEELVKLFIDESGETFGWLEDNYDFGFLPMMFAFYDSHGWPLWTMYTDSTGTSKDIAYRNSMEKAKGLNAKNDYMLELTATDLIVENGAVVGVEAKYYDGTTYKIYGDNVVLADGGYIGDADMCLQYTGAVWKTKGMTQCNGFGIKEALELGGALYNPDVAVEDHIAQVTNIIRSDEYSNDDKGILTSLVLDLNYQMIDSRGKSFDANYNGLGIAFNAWEAGSNYYVLINEAEYNDIKTKGLISFNAPMFFNQGGTYTEGTPVTNLDDILAMGEKYGNVIIADSLSDLESKLGFTIDLADIHGQTTGKIYCVIGAAYVYSTCGGLDVDTNMNLLKEDGTPVKNVYVVGNNSLGVLNKSNKAYVTYGGAAQGWALTSGRLVGEIITGKRSGGETQAPVETTPEPTAAPKPENTPAPANTPAPTPTPAAGIYNPGTYTASEFGFGGDVTATVTVDANSITSVTITGPDETPTIGGAALSTLEANALAKGADMDGVTGASLTSEAAKAAVTAALAKAKN